MRHKALKITCGIAAILIFALALTLVILFFTVFKPRDPKISANSVVLTDYQLLFFPGIQLNFSLGINLTVDNRNYGGFHYQNSTTYIHYRGHFVAEAPVEEDFIPARAIHYVYAKVAVYAEEIVSDPGFEGDVNGGTLNFTSSTTLHGKVHLFKIIKRKATTHGLCNITVFLQNQAADAVCRNKLEW